MLPICSSAAGRAKVLKQDAKPGVLQNLSSIDGRHWFRKNIGGRNLPPRGRRPQFRRSFAPETANLLVATAEGPRVDRTAGDFHRALKSRVCIGRTPPDHPAQASASMCPPRLAIQMAAAVEHHPLAL